MFENARIYIAGCGGMLGDAVYRRFSSLGTVMATDIDANEPWLSYGDVRDFNGIRESIREFRPTHLINLAAITDMENCERDPDNAWLTNAYGAENLGVIANELQIPVIYISTAGIFGGEKASFHDYDEPNPLSIYAKSKYAGEKFMRTYVSKSYVVRAGWMMGGGPKKDKKFINKIYKQLVKGQSEIFAVDDKAGTPSYTVDFARGLEELFRSGRFGVYNQVCEGSASRYDVAVQFVSDLGLAQRVKVTRVGSEFFSQDYFAPRPASERLVCMKLTKLGIYVMRDWRTCLKEYVREFPAV